MKCFTDVPRTCESGLRGTRILLPDLSDGARLMLVDQAHPASPEQQSSRIHQVVVALVTGDRFSGGHGVHEVESHMTANQRQLCNVDRHDSMLPVKSHLQVAIEDAPSDPYTCPSAFRAGHGWIGENSGLGRTRVYQ